jgi:uncharacterized RDD family membrane protein YckC
LLETAVESRVASRYPSAAMALTAKIDTLQTIEIAEGVQIQLKPAGPCVRMAAYLLDLIYFFLALLVLGIVVGVLGEMFGTGVGQGVFSLAIFLLNWFYFVWYEVRRGDSPGKKRMGLKVVTTSGSPPELGASMLRNLLRFADFLPFGYLFGVVTCLSNRNFQRIGDLVADTLVVYDAKPNKNEKALLLKNPVTPLAPRAVLSREEQSALVQFLDRAELWSPSRKEELANHVQPLTGATGKEGVSRTLSMGAWLRDS